MQIPGKLTFFCGKMGAGKSTLSKRLAEDSNVVLISEDDWLSAHYPEQIATFDDYLKYSALVRPFVKTVVQTILIAGTDVIMDFPANTVRQRSWFKKLCEEVGCGHCLVYLSLSDEQCLKQIAKRRNEQAERAHFDNETVFYQLGKYFEAPGAAEGLNIDLRNSA